MKTLAFMLGMAAMLPLNLALADEPAGADPAALFTKLDANKDGQVTTAEVGEDQKRLFERLVRNADANKDGQLSSDEFAAGLKGTRPERDFASPEDAKEGGPDLLFRTIDSNGDGTLSAAEVAAAAEGLKKLDRNGDGQVTREELAPPRGAAGPDGQPGQGAQAMLERLKQADADGDGKLSMDEAPERLQERFGEIDKDSDGFIDGQELQVMAARFAGSNPAGGPGAGQPGGGEFLKRLKEADKNNDGKLSKDEAPDRLKERFDEIDANKDGFIEMQEMRQRMQAMFGQNRPGAGQPGKRPEGKRPEGAEGKKKRPEGAPGEGGGLRQKLKQADQNGDGKLSKEEAPDRLKERFDEIDANKDGQLDPQELQKAGGKGKGPEGAGVKKRKKNQA